MGRDLVYASTNLAKITEAKRVLAPFGVSIQDLQTAAKQRGLLDLPTISEPDSTYEGNARRKACAYAALLNAPCLSDDTGIEVEELGWLPGVYTAHFGIENLREMLQVGLPYTAQFVCCAAYAEPGGRSVCTTVHLAGTVLFPSAAKIPTSSVPYSHFFVPEGTAETLAEISARGGEFESHRGGAIRRLVQSLWEA